MKLQRGATLIELMIGLTLGLMVMTVALSGYLGVMQLARTQRAAASVADGAQSAHAYLGRQLMNAGYLDLMATAGRSSQVAVLDGNAGNSALGGGDLLSTVHEPTYPGLFSLHGCNSGYATASSLLNYACEAAGDETANAVSVAYEVLATVNGWLAPSLASDFTPVQGYQSDCGAQSPRLADNPQASPGGDVVINRFYLDKATGELMCIGNGNPQVPVRLAGNVEQFVLRYALPQAAALGGEAVAQFVSATQVNTQVPTAWGSVLAVQLCLLVKGEPGSVDRSGSGTNVFNLDCLGQPVSTSDGVLRRAYRLTVSVRNSVRSAVALP